MRPPCPTAFRIGSLRSLRDEYSSRWAAGLGRLGPVPLYNSEAGGCRHFRPWQAGSTTLAAWPRVACMRPELDERLVGDASGTAVVFAFLLAWPCKGDRSVMHDKRAGLVKLCPVFAPFTLRSLPHSPGACTPLTPNLHRSEQGSSPGLAGNPNRRRHAYVSIK